MKFSSSASACLLWAGLATAAPHYTFPKLAGESDWSSVRQTTNFQSNAPVTDVSSSAIRCYERVPGAGAPSTSNVAAGGTLTFAAGQPVYHPGGLSAYMAKVPSGKTAKNWDGSGAVWFKIYQDLPNVSNGQMTWPNMNQGTFPFKIPQCIASGEYLFRIEHVALHAAGSVGGAQFYISCAQINVTGGSGSKTPSGLVSFPGAYSATDPGLLFNMYNNNGKAYQPPGPSVFSC